MTVNARGWGVGNLSVFSCAVRLLSYSVLTLIWLILREKLKCLWTDNGNTLKSLGGLETAIETNKSRGLYPGGLITV